MSITTADAPESVDLDVLWQPIKIGTSVVLPHRVIQTAHDQSFGGADLILSDKAIRYWEDRARGGAALVITGAQTVHRSALGHVVGGSEGWRPEAREQYRKLANTVHPHGTKVFVQLGHWGAEDIGMAHLWNFRELWAPSDVPSLDAGEHPRPIEAEDIDELIAGYVATALNAKEAGIDGVEFHSGHGYLGMQFLSPLTNRRDDEYGGSTENRCRFALQVARAIREACGSEFPLGIRLSLAEAATGGIDLAEGERIVRVLSASGLYDYFNISGGAAGHEFIVPMTSELREQFVPFAELVKSIVDVPVFMAGRVTDIRRAAALVAEGRVDVVGMTRAHIADPEIVVKAKSGRVDEIRQCAGINQGCIGRVALGREMSCTQNPTVGRESEWGLGSLQPVETPRRVMIVGGGPAGLKAAEIAASRGHHVSLYEAGDELGGQLRLAAQLPSRSEWGVVIENLIRAIDRHGVEVHLGTTVTDELVREVAPDVLVAATGSEFATTGWSAASGDRAGIPGLENTSVLTPEQAIEAPSSVGRRVVIVDETGMYAPLGVAELLADRGHDVRIVSRRLVIGEKAAATLDLPYVYPRLAAKHVTLQPQSMIDRVRPNGAVAIKSLWDGEVTEVDVDTVIVMMGRKSVNGLYKSVKGETSLSVHRIGDSVAPRDVDAAIFEGERLGRAL
ncbi:2,4-dienoyl-CoA reductase-like NADH-dependent reductase (Old Yellow Enzyme family)/pyruvate/2-oxoglutarate dehydrogenase complex dihydrolipoamide dehydrogenase (E3) component [Microbacterium sp. BE35]|uniref:oxidoreductase n=1 Tax=Microbacterium sp. BE35 TaxID=2817773 RepID=UPI00285E8DAD|nr:FAD-dependent oxidoreductase [Microbacterium sp. BE35]MDR7188221.1 2,4-dienoyl-CoA reductase-like NADH-dependent reductase (Old Yellow Enzyme family)/pyruvate/2-oxoglutarate dehydrogenase complex dihydrolipoamide dehydrogenase (E3) component [Microbacterium sp. BE35]